MSALDTSWTFLKSEWSDWKNQIKQQRLRDKEAEQRAAAKKVTSTPSTGQASDAAPVDPKLLADLEARNAAARLGFEDTKEEEDQELPIIGERRMDDINYPENAASKYDEFGPGWRWDDGQQRWVQDEENE